MVAAGGARSRSGTGSVPVRGVLGELWEVVVESLLRILRFRVTSLAAEVAFFTLLSMPPLVLALAGSAALLGSALDEAGQGRLIARVEHDLSPFLTPEVVGSVVVPTLTTALHTPRYDVISVGFLVALWSGSRAMWAAYSAMALISGVVPDGTKVVRQRLVAFGLYLVALVVGSLGLPLLLIGPDLLTRVLPPGWGLGITVYWMSVAVLSVVALTTIYRVAARTGSWFAVHLPGACLAMVLGVLASIGLRTFIQVSLVRDRSSLSIYGPLTAPIVVLLWLWLLAAALLVGVVFNRVLVDHRFRRLERNLTVDDAWE